MDTLNVNAIFRNNFRIIVSERHHSGFQLIEKSNTLILNKLIRYIEILNIYPLSSDERN